MSRPFDYFSDLDNQARALEARRLQMVEARRAELGKIGERLDVLRYSDEALMGALLALVGASPEEVKALEAKGATFRRKPGPKPKATANGAGQPGNETEPNPA